MTRRRRVLLLLAPLLVLLALEVVARVLASRDSRFNVFIGGSREFDAHRGQRLKRSYRSGEIRTSSLGTLGRDFTPAKARGTYRIVVLGDSCSFMPPARPWPAVLEERLHGVEVIDAACPGYDSSQARSWYEDEIAAGWEHDALVVYVGWNDLAQFHPDGLSFKLEERGYLEEPDRLQRAVSASYLLRSLYVVQGHVEKRGAVDRSALTEEERRRYDAFRPVHYESNLAAIARRALVAGRPVFVLGMAGLIREGATADEEARMNFPRGMGKKVAKLLATESAYRAVQARVRGTTFVDLEPLFADSEGRASFTDRCHFDARGAERVGARVAEAIAPLVSASGAAERSAPR